MKIRVEFWLKRVVNGADESHVIVRDLPSSVTLGELQLRAQALIKEEESKLPTGGGVMKPEIKMIQLILPD